MTQDPLAPAPGRPLRKAELDERLPGLRRFRRVRTHASFGQFDDPLYILAPRETR